MMMAFMANIGNFIVRIISNVIESRGFNPAFVLIGRIVSQVNAVRYMFAKRPCSATGGVA
jgi:hypothetical protein